VLLQALREQQQRYEAEPAKQAVHIPALE